METAASAADAIIDEFQFLDDWEEKYQHLIAMGRRLAPLPQEFMTDAHRLRGCQSVVHFVADCRDGVMVYQACSDASIVNGLIALLLRVYSGRQPQDVLATTPHFLEAIGLDTHLSPTRKNGLAALVGAIMEAARGAVGGEAK
ncbi:MAG: SufE family protein [Proteobacteria bacterium]|nr:SufE family protein [Pseudomonadota bacterium]